MWRRGGAGFSVALADFRREALPSLPVALAGVVDAAGVSRQRHRSERVAARPEIAGLVLPPEGVSDCAGQAGPVAATNLVFAWEESSLFPNGLPPARRGDTRPVVNFTLR